MRGLKRNQQTLYYQLYSEKIPLYETDLDGNIVHDPVTGEPLMTGDYTIGFEEPVAFKANISAARSEAEIDPFGITTDYSKIISTCRTDLPITETSLIYLNGKPGDGGVKYKVVRVAKSLNSVLYAIKQLPEGEHG